ncbi:hypothetical protein F2Q68_00017293, partial [Brassica cretica]
VEKVIKVEKEAARELSEAQAEIKALKLPERQREKAVEELFIGTSTVERITLILPNTFSTLFGLVLSKSSLYGCHNAYGVYVSSHIFPARIHIFTSVGFSSSTMGALRTRFAPILVSASAMSGEENAVELKIGDGNLSVIPVFGGLTREPRPKHKYEQLQQVSEDSMNQVSQVFEKSLQYVKRFSRILSRHQLTEFELCVLGNLCPETAEEAVAIVPSLKTKGRAHSDEAIEKMLNDLSLVKRFE